MITVAFSVFFNGAKISIKPFDLSGSREADSSWSLFLRTLHFHGVTKKKKEGRNTILHADRAAEFGSDDRGGNSIGLVSLTITSCSLPWVATSVSHVRFGLSRFVLCSTLCGRCWRSVFLFWIQRLTAVLPFFSLSFSFFPMFSSKGTEDYRLQAFVSDVSFMPPLMCCNPIRQGNVGIFHAEYEFVSKSLQPSIEAFLFKIISVSRFVIMCNNFFFLHKAQCSWKSHTDKKWRGRHSVSWFRNGVSEPRNRV